MDFNIFLKELDALNLPEGEWAITSSGPLAVRGIRPAGDLDLIVSGKLWADLAQKYPVTDMGTWDIATISPSIEALGNFRTDRLYTTEEQIAQADIIEGHRYVNLEMIKAFKKLLGREKDLRDLELIAGYLNDGK